MAPIRLGILMIDYQTLDAVGPVDILSSCSKKYVSFFDEKGYPGYEGLTKKAIDIEFHHIGETLDPVELTGGYKIVPSTTVDTCPPLDMLLVGGPNPFTFKLSAKFADFLRAHVATNKLLFTTCTGAFAVAASGILDGRHATLNHGAIDYAKQAFPKVLWDEEKQWVVDGNLWTSSGAFAGCDMMAQWVLENYDENLARLGFKGLDLQPRDVNRKLIPGY